MGAAISHSRFRAVLQGVGAVVALVQADGTVSSDRLENAFDFWPAHVCAFPGLKDGSVERSSVWAGYESPVNSFDDCANVCAASASSGGHCKSFMFQQSGAACWLYRLRPQPSPNPEFDCGRESLTARQPLLHPFYREGERVLLDDAQRRITVDDVAFGFELLANSEALDASLFGVHTSQEPLTLALFQEQVWKLRPDLIVEIGTECGGLTSILAELQNLMGIHDGRVVTVDIAPHGYAPWSHKDCEAKRGDSTLWNRHHASRRIRPVLRDSARWGCPCDAGLASSEPLDVTSCLCAVDDSELEAIVAEAAVDAGTVLVIDDSSHFKEDVIQNFELMGSFVTRGSLYVVADTRLDRLCEVVQRLGYPLPNGFNPGEQVRCDYYVDNGPAAAVAELFRSSNEARKRFQVDRTVERTILNSNPSGWLRAV